MPPMNIPLTKVYVEKSFLKAGQIGTIAGYWYGITSIPGRNFICHVALEDGSNWYGLSLAQLRTKPAFSYAPQNYFQAYDCFSYDCTMERFNFLRDQRIQLINKAYNNATGRYLFTVISKDGDGHASFAEFPEQAKTFNFVELDSGEIVAVPNNYMRLIDQSLFDTRDSLPAYERISKVIRSDT